MCRDGLYSHVKKVQYVVISGYDTIYEMGDKEYVAGDEKFTIYTNDFTQCLGVYDDVNEAYGRAFLYLESIASDLGEDYYISQMCNTEDTGCKFVIINPNGSNDDTLNWAWVLFNNIEYKEEV